jgi:hypothetical protein
MMILLDMINQRNCIRRFYNNRFAKRGHAGIRVGLLIVLVYWICQTPLPCPQINAFISLIDDPGESQSKLNNPTFSDEIMNTPYLDCD